MPILLPFEAWRALRAPAAERWGRLVVSAFCVLAALSVAYSPSTIYLAMISPVFLVLAADLLDWTLSASPRLAAGGRRLAWAVALSVCAAVGWRLNAALAARWAAAPLAVESAFGRINFDPGFTAMATMIEKIPQLTNSLPKPELFIYPHSPGIYLVTGADNPTPYDDPIPGFNTPEQMAEILGILERRQVRYVAIDFHFPFSAPDPIWPYVSREYQQMNLGHQSFPFPVVFERRPD